jgi:hypothetical protein
LRHAGNDKTAITAQGCADLLGRVELAALLDVHASLLDAWISGHASMPDRQLLLLTHILDKVARK